MPSPETWPRRARGAAVLVSLACATAWAEPEPPRIDHADHEHRFVRISDGKITPATIELARGDAVAWVNYSSESVRISFAREVGRHITCESPESFHLSDQRLESGEVRPRQFASLCRLDPGEYAYAVDFLPRTGESLRWTSLAGRIVVSD